MKRNKKGFTIIEIILVLGIAGLILLTVFLVVPSLWASQRDADRRTKMTDYIAALKEYQTNNSRGALPTGVDSGSNSPVFFSMSEVNVMDVNVKNTWQAFVRDYFNSKDFMDPDGKEFLFYVVGCAKEDANGHSATASTGEQCTYSSAHKANGSESYDGLKTVNGEDTSVNGGVNHVIYTVTGATCDGDTAVKSSNSRNVAVVYRLERAGRYCANT